MHNKTLRLQKLNTSCSKAFGWICYATSSLFILSILLLITSNCMAQNSKIESKIDPAFQLLIKANPEVKNVSRKKCFLKKKRKVPASVKSEAGAVKYDCIVYTKNAEALRSKGITINSVLPTFVTAKATLQQIQQMALMDEVSYIASPGMDSVPTKK